LGDRGPRVGARSGATQTGLANIPTAMIDRIDVLPGTHYPTTYDFRLDRCFYCESLAEQGYATFLRQRQILGAGHQRFG